MCCWCSNPNDASAILTGTPHDPIDHARGSATGIVFPARPDMLRGADAAVFLTAAFHAYGSLPRDNRVVAVRRSAPFAGGNSGQKLALDIAYARPAPYLPTALFAKFSRDFTDPFRDRRRFELDGEVRLAALSRLPGFPIAVARPMFGDFDPASGTGLLVTERIAFGRPPIEPLHAKCMDHELADPLAYYRVLASAQARLAAAHKAGHLSPQVDRLFPYRRAQAEADLPIAWDEAGLRAKIAALAGFIARVPQLFPPALRTPAFADKLLRDAIGFLRHEAQVRRFLQADAGFIALCHWNTNIDNAWFWREPDGALRCGLLDWGMVRQMNVATGLWGGLSASDTAFLEAELAGLLAHYAAELAAHGGPRLDPARLGLHFDLALAITGLSLMMDLPALVAARLPDIDAVTGPRDPALGADKVVQGFLLVTTNFLALWQARDFGASLAAMLAEERPY
ncbi:hypothetical protein [Novosphingobium album (ex Liu et al. 2023)]|uniref:Aminoglycoside phosphotransferase domain-containing protein n=1 Tax=Novosphingobium album (ex Liu et al. 2023) TaxID=3031130 RepID=A0ABT5WJR5_9SPHN|nr:hypothetical protein [Novosphingobium album (ex Liu et al. 2023)]MDE8650159.1 hypothetical protein [Novosphingobium album (ex Liu et al. 2023)]